MERKIGIPPPRGTIPLWVCAGWARFLRSVTKWNFFAKQMVGIVKRQEISTLVKKTKKIFIQDMEKTIFIKISVRVIIRNKLKYSAIFLIKVFSGKNFLAKNRFMKKNALRISGSRTIIHSSPIRSSPHGFEQKSGICGGRLGNFRTKTTIITMFAPIRYGSIQSHYTLSSRIKDF